MVKARASRRTISVVIIGDEGVGKTSLLAALAAPVAGSSISSDDSSYTTKGHASGAQGEDAGLNAPSPPPIAPFDSYIVRASSIVDLEEMPEDDDLLIELLDTNADKAFQSERRRSRMGVDRGVDRDTSDKEKTGNERQGNGDENEKSQRHEGRTRSKTEESDKDSEAAILVRRRTGFRDTDDDDRKMSLETMSPVSLDDDTKEKMGKADAVLIMFSVMDPGSFDSAKQIHIRDAKTFCPPGTCVVLVGSKCDLLDDVDASAQLVAAGQQPVTHAEASTAAQAMGASYCYCSARSKEGVAEVVETVTRAWLDQRESLRRQNKPTRECPCPCPEDSVRNICDAFTSILHGRRRQEH